VGAPDLLVRLAAAGVSLSPVGPDRIAAAPSAALNDELRDLIRRHKPELIAHLRRERLAGAAADKLRQHPELLRAAQIEPDGADRYLVAVAVRVQDSDIATAILTVPTADGFALLAAFDRACSAPLQ
jgi:hypothetical protein